MWPEIFSRAITLFTFIAEKMTFEILHQGMERAYVRMEDELDTGEKFLFRRLCLKNPWHLNRVLVFDPSPMAQSFRRIAARIYREFGPEKASEFLTLRKLGEIWIAYYNFYPVWLNCKLYGEAERRDLKRSELKRKGLPYGFSPNEEIASPPGYLSEDDEEAWDKSSGSHEEQEKKRPQTFFTNPEREVARRRAAGEENKEIAAALHRSPSYSSKVHTRAREKLQSSWRRGGYRPFLENHYRAMGRRYRRLSSENKTLLKSLYTAVIKEAIGQLYKGPDDERRRLEKELIPPIFRDDPST